MLSAVQPINTPASQELSLRAIPPFRAQSMFPSPRMTSSPDFSPSEYRTKGVIQDQGSQDQHEMNMSAMRDSFPLDFSDEQVARLHTLGHNELYFPVSPASQRDGHFLSNLPNGCEIPHEKGANPEPSQGVRSTTANILGYSLNTQSS